MLYILYIYYKEKFSLYKAASIKALQFLAIWEETITDNASKISFHLALMFAIVTKTV